MIESFYSKSSFTSNAGRNMLSRHGAYRGQSPYIPDISGMITKKRSCSSHPARVEIRTIKSQDDRDSKTSWRLCIRSEACEPKMTIGLSSHDDLQQSSEVVIIPGLNTLGPTTKFVLAYCA